MISISLLPLASLLRYGTYESGDFNIHIYRTIEFYNALQDGQFIPSWPENLNGTYGYPLFLFLNIIPYYLISFLHFLGFGYIASLKLYLGLTFMTSGISLWLFAKNHFKKEIAVFTATIFYLFAPYHLVDLHFRAAVGEILSFVFLPLLFLSTDRLYKKTDWYSTVLLASVLGVFIMSHHAIGVFSLLILVPYMLYQAVGHTKAKTYLSLCFISIILGFVLSSSVWVPHIILREFTFADRLQSVPVSFPQIRELMFSNWKYGLLFQGPSGQLSFLIGYTQILAVLGVMFIFIKKKKMRLKSPQFLWLILFFFLFFLMTPLSSIFWDTIPFIKSVQFSTRLLVLVTFVTSLLAGYLTDSIKNKFLIYLLIGVTVGYTILNWGHRRVIPEITDETLKNNVWKSSSEGEGFFGMGTTKWVDPHHPWIDTLPPSHLQVIKGDASVHQDNRTSIKHSYIVEAKTPTELKENTLYFPGWQITVNDKLTGITYSNPYHPGVMTFVIPPGSHKIDVSYSDILPIRIVRSISVFTGLYFLFVLLFSRKNTKRN